MVYAIFFALKYDFDIQALTPDLVIQKDSCLLKIASWLYYKKRNDSAVLKTLKNHAKDLTQDSSDMDRFWLFIYEVLPKEQLKDDWKPMKQAGISFIRNEYLT